MNSTQLRFNLLQAPGVRRLVRSAWMPLALQAGALIGLVLLAWNGWGIGVGEPKERLLTLRKTNLTTLVVWGLWWPGMIALALSLGRLWCTVCPLELASRLGDGAARRLGLRRLPLPRWMRSGWAVVGAYVLLQLLVAGVAIHRVPHYTSILLVGLLGLPVVAGLAFRESRSFCKALCPANALLSVYGRFTPVQIDTLRPDACAACTTKDCVREENRFRFDRRSCPSHLKPYAREQSDGCVTCLQCAKACPSGNIGWGLASEDAGSRRRRQLRPFEAAFVTIAAGFVSHEVIGEVKWLEELFHVPAKLVQGWVGAVDFGWVEAGWFLVGFPLALWAAIAVVGKTLGHHGGARALWLSAATGAAPVIAVAHLAKAAAKVTSWAGFFPSALRDPRGLSTLDQIASGAVAAPKPLIGVSMIGWIVGFAIALVAVQSWHWARQAAAEDKPALRAGFAVSTVFFSAVMVAWIGG